ncbi:MAG TPA: hypothetical protein VH025_04730 [Solirubrobacteraceae bacterium]|nr:hypothetical protein [Solirubrobacteraceae bacterium]
MARKFSFAAGASAAVLSIAAPAASANGGPVEILKGDLAVCPGQTFSQVFAGLGDESFYTRVPGPTEAEGWELSGGATITTGTLPDGTEGPVIDIPSGATVVSPATCVTLLYPTMRAYTSTIVGSYALQTSVSYGSGKTSANPKTIGKLGGDGSHPGWVLSEALEIKPQLGGKLEETREVRFVFTAKGGHGDTYLYGLYVDPRMV